MDFNLRERVVVVTGGSRGIGRAIAESAAAEGATVVVVGRSEESASEAVQAIGPDRSSFVLCDVADPDSLKVLVEVVVRRYGRLDAVVNNAGQLGASPIASTTADNLRKGFDTKAIAAHALVLEALPYLRKSDQARVVNISGLSAQRITLGATVTALANSAMLTLSAYQARELVGDGVNVNCIIPGYTLTGPWRERTQALARAEGLTFEEALREVLKRADMGHSRWVMPREIADVVVFLLSAQASSVNGATFRVDGGQFLSVQR